MLISLPAMLAVIGCGNDRPDVMEHPKVPRLPGTQRLVAAIVLPSEHNQAAWIFRIVGPEFAVARAKPEFQEFLRNLRFKEQKPDWEKIQLPDGWKQELDDKKKTVKHLRFVAKDGDNTNLEMDFSKSAVKGSYDEFLYKMMNIWRKQLGLKEIGIDYLCFYEKQRIGDLSMYIVETTGPGVQEQQEVPEPFKYDLPEGWEKDAPAPFSVVSLMVEKGNDVAHFTVSKVGGKLFTHINRWREEQLGLPKMEFEKLEPGDLKKEIRELKVLGLKGHYVDLIGRDMGKGGDRILGVIVPTDEQSWFFKMIGPKDLIREEKANFEKLVQSIELK